MSLITKLALAQLIAKTSPAADHTDHFAFWVRLLSSSGGVCNCRIDENCALICLMEGQRDPVDDTAKDK